MAGFFYCLSQVFRDICCECLRFLLGPLRMVGHGFVNQVTGDLDDVYTLMVDLQVQDQHQKAGVIGLHGLHTKVMEFFCIFINSTKDKQRQAKQTVLKTKKGFKSKNPLCFHCHFKSESFVWKKPVTITLCNFSPKRFCCWFALTFL